MTAHLVYDAFDPKPATVSPSMIGLIRDKIGFDGLLMTDDISMQALSGSVQQRGRDSIDAGCDLVLHCNGDLKEMIALMRWVGDTNDAAQNRANAVIAARPVAETIDIAALHAQLDALPNDPDTGGQ
jgi:beta-N-acetylhexosaminidase